MKRLAAFLLLAAACASTGGDTTVGFRVVDLYDKIRTFVPGDYMLGRPLRIRLWYPALEGGQPLVIGDYAAGRPMSGVPTDSWDEITRSDQSGIATPSRPAAARLNAPPARKRFPLVVYLPREGETLQESAETAEYLAARGFVVALTPRLGPEPSQLRSPDSELLAHDLRFVARQIRGLADVDEHRVVIVAGPADLEPAERARVLDPAIGRIVLHGGGIRTLARSLQEH